MRKNFVAIGIVGSGLFLAGILMGQSARQPAKPESPSAVARLAAAKRVCELFHDDKGAPKVHADHYLWSMRWMSAQRDVDAGRGDRFAALEAHLQRMRDIAGRTAEGYKVGVASEFEVASTQFYVAEAEELLARERAK